MHFQLFSVLDIYGDSRPTRKCVAFSSLAWLVLRQPSNEKMRSIFESGMACFATAVQRENAWHFRVWHGLFCDSRPTRKCVAFSSLAWLVLQQPTNDEIRSILRASAAHSIVHSYVASHFIQLTSHWV